MVNRQRDAGLVHEQGRIVLENSAFNDRARAGKNGRRLVKIDGGHRAARHRVVGERQERSIHHRNGVIVVHERIANDRHFRGIPAARPALIALDVNVAVVPR